jgi:hypothetical protein
MVNKPFNTIVKTNGYMYRISAMKRHVLGEILKNKQMFFYGCLGSPA